MADETPTPIIDSVMRESFASGSYWQDTGLQDRVRSALVSGAEQRVTTGGAEVIPFPAGTATSLRGDAAEYKQQLEAMIGDPNSAYWKGTPDRSAALIQQDYQDIIRAEQLGEGTPVGPEYRGADPDQPTKGHTYSLDGLPIYSAEDRSIVDLALTHFRDGGFGQARVSSVLQWALSQTSAPTEREFKSWAVAQGWSDRHIRYAIEFYREQQKEQS